jgi:hypothetical protein
VFLVGLILDAVLRQRCLRVLDGQRFAVQPDDGWMPRQRFFAVELFLLIWKFVLIWLIELLHAGDFIYLS